MDRIELHEALRAAGVPESEYRLLGLPQSAGPVQDSHYVLHEQDVVGVLVTLYERGTEETAARFPTEDEACRFLYDHLTRRAPEPPSGAAEVLDDLMAHRDEIQRRAREQLDQARRRDRG